MNATHSGPSPGLSASSDYAVTATDLTRQYGAGTTAVDALRGVSLAVRADELVGIMGLSGSGMPRHTTGIASPEHLPYTPDAPSMYFS